MGSIIGTIFAFILVFGILVFVHEFGHFFMAKLVGIRVDVFSFGYGKRLIGFKKGDTDYRISLIPMGGYVKFPGEEALEQQKPPQPGDFHAAKRWQRLLVIFMGPLMNVVLAIVLMAVINMVGALVPLYQSQPPVIGWIETDSPAARAGLRIDDEILAINEKETKNWGEVELAVGSKPEKTIEIDIRRDSQILRIDLLTESRTRYEMGYAGFLGKIRTQVKMVMQNTPAEKAGLQPGDVILDIDDRPVYFNQFLQIIQENPDNELKFLVKRGEENLSLSITPRRKGTTGEIGIAHTVEAEEQKYGFFSAFGESFRENVKLIFLVVDFLKDLMTGEGSTKQLGGPIEIANLSYTAFRMGLIALMSWIALISLQLGVINLFPIPVLDGGQILVLILEGIFRRDFSPKLKQIIMQIGFAIFIFLIVFVILNDVVKRLPNGWQSLIPF